MSNTVMLRDMNCGIIIRVSGVRVPPPLPSDSLIAAMKGAYGEVANVVCKKGRSIPMASIRQLKIGDLQM